MLRSPAAAPPGEAKDEHIKQGHCLRRRLFFSGCTGCAWRRKVRIGFPVQIHTANMMLLQDYAKKDGVDLEVATMRGYPSIQLALTTNELDVALLGFVNVGLMEEKGLKTKR